MFAHSITEPNGSWRGFLHFEMPTHVVCWMRGHRAKVEVIEPESRGIEPWLLIQCRVCDLRHNDPYLSRGMKTDYTREQAEADVARLVAAARTNPVGFAEVRDGRDGYGHRKVCLSLEVAPRIYHSQGFKLHVGDRWSETPFDASLHILRWSLYFSIEGLGNRLAQRLAKGKKADVKVGAKFIEATP